MSRTIFIEEPRAGHRDLEQVQRFGDPIVLCERSVRRPGVLSVKEYGLYILERLEEIDYNCDTDFIVLTGPVLVLQFAVTAAIARYGKIKVLAFHAVSEGYVERLIETKWFKKGQEYATHQRSGR